MLAGAARVLRGGMRRGSWRWVLREGLPLSESIRIAVRSSSSFAVRNAAKLLKVQLRTFCIAVDAKPKGGALFPLSANETLADRDFSRILLLFLPPHHLRRRFFYPYRCPSVNLPPGVHSLSFAQTQSIRNGDNAGATAVVGLPEEPRRL